MQAMFSLSLGAFRLWVAPMTCLGTTMMPAAVAAAVPRKVRRDTALFSSMFTFLVILSSLYHKLSEEVKPRLSTN
jgi:hypothetical protein